MTDLSPAAQAVLRDARITVAGIYDDPRRYTAIIVVLTGVLRALAVRINGADAIRQDVLERIADELEAQ
jgi:hypothetical protein